jgi:hypothetical protein
MTLLEDIKRWFSTIPASTDPLAVGDQILYDSFTHLQNFVEYNLAQIYTNTSDNTFKSRQKGLEGIEWLISQKNKEKVYQAALNEIKVLYIWWVDLRTKRTKPFENTTYDMFKDEWLTQKEEDNEEFKDFMDKCRHAEKLNNLYNIEDTKMLLRLIQVRNYL